MAKKVPIDLMAAAIDKALAKYGDEVKDNIAEIVKVMSKQGAKAVAQNARGTFGGSGAYAQGWTTRMETGRTSTQGIIYNAAKPGLPHLLENGHANRGGGRTPGRAHIAPVEAEIAAKFEAEVKAKL